VCPELLIHLLLHCLLTELDTIPASSARVPVLLAQAVLSPRTSSRCPSVWHIGSPVIGCQGTQPLRFQPLSAGHAGTGTLKPSRIFIQALLSLPKTFGTIFLFPSYFPPLTKQNKCFMFDLIMAEPLPLPCRCVNTSQGMRCFDLLIFWKVRRILLPPSLLRFTHYVFSLSHLFLLCSSEKQILQKTLPGPIRSSFVPRNEYRSLTAPFTG
jgi:hypothetical protein